MRTRRFLKSPITASSATSSKSCPPSPKPWKKRKPHNLLQIQSRSLCYNESKSMTVQREQLEADVLIVGAGPAGGAFLVWRSSAFPKEHANTPERPSATPLIFEQHLSPKSNTPTPAAP